VAGLKALVEKVKVGPSNVRHFGPDDDIRIVQSDLVQGDAGRFAASQGVFQPGNPAFNPRIFKGCL
jgi:hypothetical protein